MNRRAQIGPAGSVARAGRPALGPHAGGAWRGTSQDIADLRPTIQIRAHLTDRHSSDLAATRHPEPVDLGGRAAHTGLSGSTRLLHPPGALRFQKQNQSKLIFFRTGRALLGACPHFADKETEAQTVAGLL